MDTGSAERTPVEADRLLDEHEAAQMLSVSVKTVRDWRYRRVGPPWVKVMRAVRYRLADLKQFIRNNVVQPSPRRSVENKGE